MYTSFQNQLYNLGHYIFAVVTLFIIYPSVTFEKTNRSRMEGFFSGFIRMVFLIIVVVYILTFTKLYEFLSASIVMIFILLFKRFGKSRKERNVGLSSKVIEKILNYVEKIESPREDIKSWIKGVFDNLARVSRKRESVLFNILLIIIFAFSIYIRFYDAFTQAAPPMADSYVVIGWSKWLSRNEPFFYGIYPKGFHAIITMVQKFSFIDYLYIVKYSGPLCNVLITLGIYFFASRLFSSKFSSVVSAVIYGILIESLTGGGIRQASSNAQEFGYIFIIPTIYFFYKYITESKKQDFISAFLGFTITALVHPLATLFAAIAGGTVIVISLLTNFKKHVKQVVNTLIAGAASGGIALLPIAIGLIMGKKLDNSSAEFLTATTDVVRTPPLMISDYAALVSIGIIFVNIILNIRRLESKLMEIIIFSLSILAFFLYYLLGSITQSTLVITRFSGLWQLLIPLIIGLGTSIVLKIIKDIKKRTVIEAVSSIVLICTCMFYLKPKPIIPYKMEHNSNVEQYLRIKKMFRSTEWTVVSDVAGEDGGYDLVLGTGYHTHILDFISMYNPEAQNTFLTNKDTGYEEKSTDIFIYYEKKIFKAYIESIVKELNELYEKREKYYVELMKWIEKYEKEHSNLSIFYEDENIRIYRIHQEVAREEVNNRIWGN